MSLAQPLDTLGSDVLARACAGERAAVERVVGALQRPFYNLALRMLGDRSLAEDATQECLLRVLTHLSQFRSEAKFSTWATRIAVNAIFDFRSGIARAARIGFDEFAAGLAAGRDHDAVPRPEDALLLKQLKTICNRALLRCLDGDHRVAFVLGEILEIDGAEAAAILDITPATWRKRLSRARAELSAFLAKQCSVHTEGASCACHQRLDFAVASGRVAPASLEVTIGDLFALRRRLVVLDADARTTALYQADETPDLRAEVLDAIRGALFRVRTTEAS